VAAGGGVCCASHHSLWVFKMRRKPFDDRPLPNNPTPALGPSGLQPWPFRPRSLPPQILLPKSTYVVNWTYFNPHPFIIPYIMLYYKKIIIVNPNSLRPYHTTLGPAAGPTCSKILASPLSTTTPPTLGEKRLWTLVHKQKSYRPACWPTQIELFDRLYFGP